MFEVNKNIPKAPFPEGFSKNPEILPKETPPLSDFFVKISGSTSLKELQKEFVFFNHGALIVLGASVGDPVRRYCTFNNGKLHGSIFTLRSDFPLFEGLSSKLTGDLWNYTLIGCPIPDWPDLRDYLDKESTIDRNTNTVKRALAQERFPIIDWMALRSTSVLPIPAPTVEIDLYGVDSNKYCAHFIPAHNPPVDRILLKYDNAFSETIMSANKMLRGGK